MSDLPSVEELRRFFSYSPETGQITWRVQRGNTAAPGAVAGNMDSKGHWRIRLKGRSMGAHAVAWALMTGAWPVHFVDHINRVKDDNRWCNLREATRGQNCTNRIYPDRHLPKGVTFLRGKFSARISVEGRRLWLGWYTDVDEAEAAYKAAQAVHHGEFAPV